ncbi:hypothetical protein Aperf_G00000025341 [Anoplocephala perfoliata]
MVTRRQFEEALQYSHSDTIVNLIDSMVNVDLFEDDHTTTPVILAVAHGRHDALTLLIQRNAQLDKLDQRSLGVLHMAAIMNDVISAEKIVAGGLSINDDILNNHPSPFWFAAALGNLEMVLFFMKYCVSIPRRARNSRISPLILAAKNGHFEVVEYLFNEGDIYGEELYIAMCNACMFCHYDVVRLLLSKGVPPYVDHLRTFHPPLCSAAATGDRQMVDLILSFGGSVNVEDGDGVTPLMRAAEHGHYNIAELLLARGSDVNHAIKDSYITAFDFTNEEDMLNLLSIYREKRCDEERLAENRVDWVIVGDQ